MKKYRVWLKERPGGALTSYGVKAEDKKEAITIVNNHFPECEIGVINLIEGKAETEKKERLKPL